MWKTLTSLLTYTKRTIGHDSTQQMVEWRSRGYVEDSDDEHSLSDSGALDIYNAPQATTTTDSADFQNEARGGELQTTSHEVAEIEEAVAPTPTDFEEEAVKAPLEAEKHDGYEDIDELQVNEPTHDILSSLPRHPSRDKPDARDTLDVFDIPLSQPDNAPALAPRSDKDLSNSPLLTPESSSKNGRAPSPKPLDVVLEDQIELPGQHLAQDEGAVHGRTFRQRNPIQVHPYQLENESYRQTLRARGLRPVHVANEELRRQVESQNDAKQLPHDARSDSEPFMFSSSSSEPSVSSSPPVTHHAQAAAGHNYEDELPSLDDLLKRRSDGTLQRAQKRRKIKHRPEYSPSYREAGDGSVNQNTFTPDAVARKSEAQGLRSPDNSGRHTHFQHMSLKKFKHPKGYQSTPLLTPGPSSDAEKQRFETAQIDITSDIDSTASPMRPLLDDRLSTEAMRRRSVSASEASSDDNGAIRRARKRIRGVLPASWLNIDQQTQTRKPTTQIRRDRSPSPLGTTPHRGVAQRVSSKFKVSDASRDTFDPIMYISDESDGQTSTRQLIRTPSDSQGPSLTRPSTRHPLDTQDLDEDDWIDPMLPTATRNRSFGSKSTKRQIRLKDAFARSHGDVASYRAKPLDHNQKSSKPSTRPTHRRAQTKLSIVDAVDSPSRERAPDFLRLALRQVEKRKDRGRHSPSCKQISFHEPRDTGYAEDSIRSWKRGRLKTRTTPKNTKLARSMPRQPLREQSGNRQTRLPSPMKVNVSPSNTTLNQSTSSQPAGRAQCHRHSRQNRQTQLTPVCVKEPSRDDVATLTSTHQKSQRVDSRKTRTTLVHALFARPGQLEDLRQTDGEDALPSYAFKETLLDLDDTFDRRRAFQQRTANPMLDRYLSPERVNSPLEHAQSPITIGQVEGKRNRMRKRRPRQHIASAATVSRLDFEDHFPSEKSLDFAKTVSHRKPCVIAGLAPYGATYTTDFGIRALPEGTFFHESTFVGSLALQDALRTGQRDMSRPSSSTTIVTAKHSWHWSSWNEEVASQLEEVLLPSVVHDDGNSTDCIDVVAEDSIQADQISIDTLRSVVSYFAKSLSFSDEHDRVHCVRRVTAVLKACLQRQTTEVPRRNDVDSLSTLMFLAVLAFQTHALAQESRVAQDTRRESEQVFEESTRAIARKILATGISEIRSLLRAAYQAANGQYCLRAHEQASEGLVVLYHLAGAANITTLTFWDIINGALAQRTPATFIDLTSLESSWEDIFTVLPLLQIDAQGLTKPAIDLRTDHAVWASTRALLSRTLQLYEQAETSQGATMNSYIRAVLTRCLQLMLSWKWGNAESVLGCIYDFFARKGFALLDHEGCKGSLRFLETLDQAMCIQSEPSDRSFEIFLKMLVLGLNDARTRQSYKKVKNLIWRFIPNHGRRHAKEADLLETDLDKLRNQHNLLCVLYRVSPASHRLSTTHLQNLVDIKSSHFEIVRINIRSWTNLVRFQLSTEESPAAIEPFAQWFKSMLRDLIYLHREARREADTSFANNSNEAAVLRDTLESVVAKNERQVEGLITMLLASLNALIDSARNRTLSRHMFEHCDLSTSLALFDPTKPRLFRLVSLAFDLYQTYFRLCSPEKSSVNHEGDDSQDFGDWSDVEALANNGEATGKVPQHLEQATKEVHKTLSDCFGAEGLFDEALLKKATDTWVYACNTLANLNQRNWSYFLDIHSTGSWSQLRDTEQSRIYSVYYAARVVVVSPTAYIEHQASLLTTWITSLVERESTLKFQHILTNALLTVDNQGELLQNIPFWSKPGSSDYSISLEELRGRRLSLISSVLANIRRFFEDVNSDTGASGQRLRTELTSLLRAMMGEMKRTYQELQQATSLRGAYVDFVQKVIEYLQQYTAEVVPIDKFFTDTGAFPLPATDPMYVVGRLKSYRSSLSDERSQKKLTIFLQIVCERAAADNQQAYLVGQLSSAVEGLWEDAKDSNVSLHVLFLEALFPCYVAKSLSTDCGWILALPILEAVDSIFAEIAYSFDGLDLKTLSSIARLTTSILKPMKASVSSVAIEPMLLHQAHVTRTVRAVYLSATSMLSIADYIVRFDTPNCDPMVSHLKYLHAFAQVLLRLSQSQDARLDTSQHPEPDDLPPRTQLTNITGFCDKELAESLRNNWVKHEGEYFIIRGRDRREVAIDLSTPEQEQEELIDTVERFVAGWERMPALKEVV